MIKNEIDVNRPMTFRIASGAVFQSDFDHVIVVDGYDNTGGQYMVHANYGWDDGHTAWYTLNTWHCGDYDCSWDEEEMIRNIYPRDGLCGSYSGTLSPWRGAGSLHHYIYCDVSSNNMTIQGGARVQFLPGVSLKCNGNSINIDGGTPEETRFFSEGLPTRGLKVAGGGQIKLKSDGMICVY